MREQFERHKIITLAQDNSVYPSVNDYFIKSKNQIFSESSTEDHHNSSGIDPTNNASIYKNDNPLMNLNI